MTYLPNVDVPLLLAGAAGGVVRWISLRQDWREGVPAIIAGALCSAYLATPVGPALEKYFPLFFASPGSAASVAGFLVGVLGIAISGFLLDLFHGWAKKYIKGTTKE